MPAIGIVREQIVSGVGQVVTSGVMNDSSHGYTLGADLYIDSTPGALTTTIPTGESKGIQKIGKVVSANHIIVQGAFRTNATPNLDEGNIFLGNAAGVAHTASFNTTLASNLAALTSVINTTANVQINPDTEIDGMKGFTYDVTNNFLGLGTTTPEAAFHQISDNNGLSATVLLTEYSTATSAGDFRFQRGEGTLASPSVMNIGDRIGQIRWEPAYQVAANTTSYGIDFNSTLEIAGFADGTQGATDTFTNANGDFSQYSQHTGNGIDRAIQDVQAHDYGTLTVDSITFADGQVYDDGTRVVISGVTESNVTPLQTFSVFYLKYVAGDGGRYELYDDDQLTTGSQRVTGSGFYTSGVGEVEVKPDQLYFTDTSIAYFTGQAFLFSGATDANVTPLNNNIAYVLRTGSGAQRRYRLYKDAARTIPWNLTGTIDLAGLQVEVSHFYQPTGLQIDVDESLANSVINTSIIKVRANGEIQLGCTSTFNNGTGNVTITTEGNISTVANVDAVHFNGNISGTTGDFTGNISADTLNGNVSGTTGDIATVTASTKVVTDLIENNTGNNLSVDANIVLSSYTTSANTTTAVQDVQAHDNGTLVVDSIGFSGGQIFSDGTLIYYQNATDSNVTPLNTLSFYLKWTSGDGGRFELYDDAGFTTGSTRVTGSGFYSSNVGEVVTTVNTTTGQSITTTGNISAGNVIVGDRLQLKSYSNTEIIALTGLTAGEVVYNSTDNLVSYYDGTNWRNIAQGAIVT
jgi:hypothetical protein